MTKYYQTFSSPIGRVHIIADNTSLRSITFDCNWQAVNKTAGDIKPEHNGITEQTLSQLQEYFAGKRTAFDLPIGFRGTEFQQQAWQALLSIPYGETRSYSEQARLIGNPKAVRAVGRANGMNPIAIVVPCHRVIGKSGKLTGYAGGLDIKFFLLDLESQVNPRPQAALLQQQDQPVSNQHRDD